MAKGESTLSTRYRLRKNAEATTLSKTDSKVKQTDHKALYGSVLGRTTPANPKKRKVSNSDTKAILIESKPRSEDKTKHAVVTMDKYILRESKNDSANDSTSELAVEASVKVDELEGDEQRANKKNEESRKHALTEDEDNGAEANEDRHVTKARKVSTEPSPSADSDDHHTDTQEPLTPVSQISDGDSQPEPANKTPQRQIATSKLPLSPMRTPTKSNIPKQADSVTSDDDFSIATKSYTKSTAHSASLELLNPTPGTPVRFRQPQSSNEIDVNHVNHVYRLRQDRTGLKLPDKYEALERIHYALDHTILFTTAQNSVCHFHKIKKPVENMSRRTFDMRQLAQIRHIQPDDYSLRPIRVIHEGQRMESLQIGFPDDEPETVENNGKSKSGIVRSKKIVTASQIEERKQQFHNKLLSIVKSHHNSFLKTLNADVPDNDSRILKQWHSLFDLESVADIPQAELPSFPSKIVDAAEYIRTGSLKSKISDTLAKLDKKLGPSKQPTAITQTDVKATVNPATASSESENNGSIKSRTSSLLERIRAKQQKKQENAMYEPSPAAIQRNILLSRLPDMIDSIYYMYTSAKRNVMFVREVSRKLSESYKVPLSENEAEEHINLLAEVTPKWCSIAVADTGSILRIDRTVPLKSVKSMLSEKKT